jgi:hypothetical protein
VASNRVFLNSFTRNVCFGREKEASDLASEASADLSDFPAIAVSVPFARENLHLVISFETQSLYLHYSIVVQRAAFYSLA